MFLRSMEKSRLLFVDSLTASAERFPIIASLSRWYTHEYFLQYDLDGVSLTVLRKIQAEACLCSIQFQDTVLIPFMIIDRFDAYPQAALRQLQGIGEAAFLDDRIEDDHPAFAAETADLIESQRQPGGCPGQDRSDILSGLGVVVLGAETGIAF